MYLEELCNDIQLEGEYFESKAILNRDDILGWLKTIAGFANNSGGDFYIGVEDKTNKLIGFDRKSADSERNFFNNQVNEHITPRPVIKISFLRYEINNSERFLIKASVKESSVKPVIFKYKNIPAIFMRRDGFTNGATYEEIIDMSIKSKNIPYDVLDSDIKYESSHFTELFKFYQKNNNESLLQEKSLMSLGFANENGYLANGAVLFMDGYCDKKTEVQISLFSGFNKGSERIVSINKYCGNLTSSIDFIMDFVNTRMNHSIIKLCDRRINIDAYPKRALFEGVINAIAHRDYFLDGTQIQVDMFKDRLEISSPGGFYKGEKLGKTYDLSKIISKRRNELITGVLVLCNVMEAAGTGFDKIMEEYKNADQAHKPYIYSTSDHFTLVLPDLTYDNGVEHEMIPSVSFMPVGNSSQFDEKILSFCTLRARKISDIASHLGIADSTYLRKQIIGILVDNGYLIKDRISRTSYYKTNPDMVEIQ